MASFRSVMKTPTLHCVLISLLWLTGCHSSQPVSTHDDANDEPQVYAVSYGLKYLAQEIVGDFCEVEMPDFDGKSPTLFSPSLNDIRRLQKFDLLIANGSAAPVAKWLDEISIPSSIIFEATDGIYAADFIVAEEAPSHSHGPEGEHSHSVVISTTWLDPKVAADQAEVLCERLCQVFPKQAELFQQNYENLKSRLLSLSKKMESIEFIQGTKTLSSEPSFKYLLRRMKIDDQHFFWTQEKSGITQELWRDFDETREKNADVMLWQKQPVQEVLDKLAERKIKVVELDLMIAAPIEGDYFSAMKKNIAELERTLIKP